MSGDIKVKRDSGPPVPGGDQVQPQIQFLQNFNVNGAFQPAEF